MPLDTYAIPFIGPRVRMAEVDRKLARAYVAHLEKKALSPASIKKCTVPLAAMFATAVEDGDLPANPFAGLRINARHANEPTEHDHAKTMTSAELASFLSAVPDQHRPLFTMLAETGLRISEALGLNVGDVKFGVAPKLEIRRQYYRGTLAQLKTRNGRRELPLSAASAQALWPLCAGLSDDAPLFSSRVGTRLLDGNLRRDALMPAARTAGVQWAGFHTFRHTCASLLFEQGRNIAQVSKWLGHADPAFTLRTYVHLMDEGVGGALSVAAAAPVDTLAGWTQADSGSVAR
jgi:integrase